jgi:hypothetical protein
MLPAVVLCSRQLMKYMFIAINSKAHQMIRFLTCSIFALFLLGGPALHSQSANCLSGTYSIGSGGDYASLSDAIAELYAEGVCGPVTMQLETGVHAGPFAFSGTIPGASLANRIVFESANQVVWSTALVAEGTDTDNYVLYLNDVSFLTFRYMTLENSSDTYGNVVVAEGTCQGIEFSDVLLYMADPGNPFSFPSMVGLHFNGGLYPDFRFENSEIYGGMNALIMAPSAAVSGFQFVGNYVSNGLATALDLNNLITPSIEDNVIEVTGAASFAQGITIYWLYNGGRIERNRLLLSGCDVTAMSLYKEYDSDSLIIANNVVQLEAFCFGQGIVVDGQQIYLYHNTVISETDHAALMVVSGDQLELRNNLLASDYEVIPLLSYSVPTNFDSDYNNFFSGSGMIADWGFNQLYALSDFQNASFGDQNSYNVSALYSGTFDFIPQNNLLNNAGIFLPAVPTDLLGIPRSMSGPDIGAVEFDGLAGADVAAVGILLPQPAIGGVHTTQVIIRNTGTIPIDSVFLDWAVDGNHQGGAWYIPASPMALLQQDTLSLGSFVFSAGNVYNVQAWSSLPNNGVDVLPANDTASLIYTPALAGVYTIGGIDPDFVNFTEATSALKMAGVAGPTSFLVRDGVYQEQIDLEFVEGSSPINTITFRSESEDSTAVTLRYDVSSFDTTYVLLLHGARHLRFEQLHFDAASLEYASPTLIRMDYYPEGFSFSSTLEDIAIQNCLFTVADTVNGASGIFAAAFGDSKMLLENNRFEGLAWPVRYYGNSIFPSQRIRQLEIRNNEIIGFQHDGIGLTYIDSAFVHGNLVFMDSTGSFGSGINLDFLYKYVEVTGNTVRINSKRPLNMNVDWNAQTSLIANNVFHSHGTGNFGVDVYKSNFYHNTVYNSAQNGSGVTVFRSSGDSDVRNNIFYGQNTSTCILIHTEASDTQDYNVFYGSGLFNQYRRGFGVYNTLSDYQLGIMQEQNSLLEDPAFTDTLLLRPSSPLVDNVAVPIAQVPTDIQGSTRDASNPDPGAFEFSTFTDFELVYAIVQDSSCKFSEVPYWVTLRVLNRLNQPAALASAWFEMAGIPTIEVLLDTLPISPGDTLEYTFPVPLVFPESGNKTVFVYIQHPEDISPLDNVKVLGYDILEPVLAAFLPDTTVCRTEPVIITLPATGYTYEWSTGGTFYINGAFNTQLAGTTTYSVTATDVNDCVFIGSFDITVTDPRLTIQSDQVCAGEQVVLSYADGNSIVWDLGDVTDTLVLQPAPGTFITEATITSDFCVKTTQIGYQVFQHPSSILNMLPSQGSINVPMPVLFSWQNSAFADVYDVYIWQTGLESRPGTPTISNLSSNAISNNSLLPNTAYTWQVKARNAACETWSDSLSFTTIILPDLTIENLQTPPNAFTNQEISISYTVRNLSGTTGNFIWKDWIWLSLDEDLRIAEDILLKQIPNQSFLHTGDSYTVTTTVKLPVDVLGNYKLFVSTNLDDAPCVDPACTLRTYHTKVFEEANEQNNFAFNDVFINYPPAPDLLPISLGAPTIAFGADTVTVTYLVRNAGDAGLGSQFFTDVILLSPDSAELNANARIVKAIFNETLLLNTPNLNIPFVNDQFSNVNAFFFPGAVPITVAEDSVYVRQVQVVIPHNLVGPHYFHLVVDAKKQVFEAAAEDNNHLVSEAIQISLRPPADLVVTQLVVPDSASIVSSFSFNYTVENQGFNSVVESSWFDYFYLSSHPVFHPDSLIFLNLRQVNGQTGMAPGATYSPTISASYLLEGAYYLYVHTDATNSVFEFTADDNNILRSVNPIQFYLPDFPDLTVVNMSISAIDTVFADAQYTITYTVANVGTATATGAVTDEISMVFGAPPPLSGQSAGLKSLQYGINLAPGDSLIRQTTVTIPRVQANTANLVIRINVGAGVNENNANQNNLITYSGLFGSPRPYFGPSTLSDMMVQEWNTPSSALAGTTIQVSGTMLNLGPSETQAPSWGDVVYFREPITGTEFGFQTLIYNGLVEANESYSLQIPDFKIPSAPVGPVLLCLTNVYPQSLDLNNQNNEQCNPFVILKPPHPDLRPDTLYAEGDFFANSVKTVHFEIGNYGSLNVQGNYVLRFSLSNTPDLSGSKTVVGYKLLSNTPNVGEFVADSADLVLPVYLNGFYYLVMEVDANNTILEYDFEDNNLQAIQVFVNPISQVPGDLIVTELVYPDTVQLGDWMPTIVRVQNIGGSPLTGISRSAFYWSENQSFETDQDPLLSFTDLSTSFQANAMAPPQSFFSTGRVVDLLPGDYYGIGRANVTNTLPETDLSNNTLTSPTTIHVTVPLLEDSIPRTESFLPGNVVRYYRFDAPADKDLLVKVESNAISGFNNLYGSFASVPGNLQHMYANAFQGTNPQLLIPETQAGSYFFLVEPTQMLTQSFDITAMTLNFTLLDVSPFAVGRGKVTTRLQGAGFRNNMTCLLKSSGGDVLATGTVKEFISTMEALISWDFTAVPEGLYDVELIRPDLETTYLANAVQIEPATPLKAGLLPFLPDIIRFGRKADVSYIVRNISNVDIDYVKGEITYLIPHVLEKRSFEGDVFFLADLIDTAYYEPSDLFSLDSFQLIPFVVRDLAPGEEVRINLTFSNFAYNDFPISASVVAITEEDFVESFLKVSNIVRESILNDPDNEVNELPDLVGFLRSVNSLQDSLLNFLVNTGLVDANAPALTKDYCMICADNTGVLAPGGSPGLMDLDTLSLKPGHGYVFEINDPNGTAGHDPGWDYIRVWNEVEITATPDSTFIIHVVSLSSYSNWPGYLTSFAPGYDHSWPILYADGGVINFDTSKFEVDYSLFAELNNLFGGHFYLSYDPLLKTIFLNFQAAIPAAGQKGWPGNPGQPGKPGGKGGPGGQGQGAISAGQGGDGGTGGIGVPSEFSLSGEDLLPGRGGDGGPGGDPGNTSCGGIGGNGGRGGWGGPGQQGGQGGNAGPGGACLFPGAGVEANNGLAAPGISGFGGDGEIPGLPGLPDPEGLYDEAFVENYVGLPGAVSPWDPNDPGIPLYTDFDESFYVDDSRPGPDDFSGGCGGETIVPPTSPKAPKIKPGGKKGLFERMCGSTNPSEWGVARKYTCTTMTGTCAKDIVTSAAKGAVIGFGLKGALVGMVWGVFKCAVSVYECKTGGNDCTNAFGCITAIIELDPVGGVGCGLSVMEGIKDKVKENEKKFVKLMFPDNQSNSVPLGGPCDPNEIVGPMGVDSVRFVNGQKRLEYTVFFENDSLLADLPAQRVEIRVALDTSFNPFSVNIGDFGFHQLEFEVPSNRFSYTTLLKTGGDIGVDVQLTAGVDIIQNELFWVFQSVDPGTGLPPYSPILGMLAVNDTLGNGEGFVKFSIVPKTSSQTGEDVSAMAYIYFDINPPIITNTWENTLDMLPPSSMVNPLPAETDDFLFEVSWFGQDDPGGSGLAFYEVYAALNDGPFELYLVTADTSHLFSGVPGNTFHFYTRAVDQVFLKEDAPLVPDASIHVRLACPEIEFVPLLTQPCEEQSPGSIELTTVSAGQPPFLYSADNGMSFQEDSVFNNLQAGEYRILIIDALGCGSDTLVVQLDALPQAQSTWSYSGCSGDGYEIIVNGTSYNESNPTGTETLPGAAFNGCDSVVTVQLTFLPGCGANDVTISGTLMWSFDNTGVQGATVNLSGDANGTQVTTADGTYSFEVPEAGTYTITPTKNDNHYQGVDVADVTRIQQHVTGVLPFTDPFQFIAADVNQSNSVSTLDALIVAQALIGNPIAIALFETHSWRFTDAAYTFPLPGAPWNFPEFLSFPAIQVSVANANFIGSKMGDVTGDSGNPSQLEGEMANRNPGVVLQLLIDDQELTEGQNIRILVSAGAVSDLAAWQFALQLDTNYLRIEHVQELIQSPVQGGLEFSDFIRNPGVLKSLFYSPRGLLLAEGAPLFEITCAVLRGGAPLRELISMGDNQLAARSYNTALERGGVELSFTPGVTLHQVELLRQAPQLYQNRPNPFAAGTSIPFFLPSGGKARIQVHSITGQLVYDRMIDGVQGMNELHLGAQELGHHPGVLFYTLQTENYTATKRMVLVAD